MESTEVMEPSGLKDPVQQAVYEYLVRRVKEWDAGTVKGIEDAWQWYHTDHHYDSQGGSFWKDLLVDISIELFLVGLEVLLAATSDKDLPSLRETGAKAFAVAAKTDKNQAASKTITGMKDTARTILLQDVLEAMKGKCVELARLIVPSGQNNEIRRLISSGEAEDVWGPLVAERADLPLAARIGHGIVMEYKESARGAAQASFLNSIWHRDTDTVGDGTPALFMRVNYLPIPTEVQNTVTSQLPPHATEIAHKIRETAKGWHIFGQNNVMRVTINDWEAAAKQDTSGVFQSNYPRKQVPVYDIAHDHPDRVIYESIAWGYERDQLNILPERVPDVVHLLERMAKLILLRASISADSYDHKPWPTDQEVISTTPGAGAEVPANRTIRMEVGRRKDPIDFSMPNLRGQHRTEYQNTLTNVKLHWSELTVATTETAPDTVSNTDPLAGANVKEEDTVKVYFNTAVTVPDLRGQDPLVAENTLNNMGLKSHTCDERWDCADPVYKCGQVVRVTPVPGTVVLTNVDVELGIGFNDPKPPPLITVPNIVGMLEDMAKSTLITAGDFNVLVTYENSKVKIGLVAQQDPVGDGTHQVPRGGNVSIVVNQPYQA